LFLESYQGTLLKTPNLTATANKRAMITAQVSSEMECPFLRDVELPVVDIQNLLFASSINPPAT